MDTSYTFNLRRRLKGAVPPLAVAGVFVLLLAVFRPERPWAFWLLVTLATVMVLRALAYLAWGRAVVVVDARGLTRSGHSVRYDGAELELRTVERGGKLALREVVLWPPRPPEGKREGVGFDESLDRFEQAVRTLVSRVPEMRIRVSTLQEADVQDARREAVLAPLRPTAADRALLELGRSALSAPPHLRN
jgi:hypothetical protein